MKSFTLTLTQNQMNALGYILRNAHHIPSPNPLAPTLAYSREILDAMEDAPETNELEQAIAEANAEGCRVVR